MFWWLPSIYGDYCFPNIDSLMALDHGSPTVASYLRWPQGMCFSRSPRVDRRGWWASVGELHLCLKTRGFISSNHPFAMDFWRLWVVVSCYSSQPDLLEAYFATIESMTSSCRFFSVHRTPTSQHTCKTKSADVDLQCSSTEGKICWIGKSWESTQTNPGQHSLMARLRSTNHDSYWYLQ